jgi:hypothetical protein
MKRSEMIQIIASECVCSQTKFMSFDRAQQLAEYILARLEAEGMVPPQIFKGTEHDVLNAYVNQWENE